MKVIYLKSDREIYFPMTIQYRYHFGKTLGEFLLNISMFWIENQHKNVTSELNYLY